MYRCPRMYLHIYICHDMTGKIKQYIFVTDTIPMNIKALPKNVSR